jgi:hypothetical protein
MRTRDRDGEVQLRFTRLEAAVRRIDTMVAELGVQLAVLRWRVDRIMDGSANALTEAAAKIPMSAWPSKRGTK